MSKTYGRQTSAPSPHSSHDHLEDMYLTVSPTSTQSGTTLGRTPSPHGSQDTIADMYLTVNPPPAALTDNPLCSSTDRYGVYYNRAPSSSYTVRTPGLDAERCQIYDKKRSISSRPGKHSGKSSGLFKTRHNIFSRSKTSASNDSFDAVTHNIYVTDNHRDALFAQPQRENGVSETTTENIYTTISEDGGNYERLEFRRPPAVSPHTNSTAQTDVCCLSGRPRVVVVVVIVVIFLVVAAAATAAIVTWRVLASNHGSSDGCWSNPCLYGATCTAYMDLYNCTCPIGFTGSNCEINIDDCQSNPCVHGVCRDLVNSYECRCVEGYTGTNCVTDTDDCMSAPCVRGSCTDLVNSYKCTCTAGFTGFNCESDINECTSNPCVNGGTCRDQVGSFMCQCPPGWDGTNCQTGPVFSSIFYMEHSIISGYISKLSSLGNTTQYPSGETNEYALVLDNVTAQIFYTTCANARGYVWRASVADIGATKKSIWSSNSSECARGLALSKKDKIIFVDQPGSGIALTNYNGTQLGYLNMSKGISYGMVADEASMLLYFTDWTNGTLYKIAYNTTRFISGPVEVLPKAQIGPTPSGLVLNHAGDTLYWILSSTGEIRSWNVGNGSVTTVVLPSGTNYYGFYLATKGPYLYNTVWNNNGGIHRSVISSGERKLISRSLTLSTTGLIVT